MTLLLAMSLLLTAETEDPAYILEYPGIYLMFLPDYMIPLAEGVLTEETGSVACQPNEAGVTFLIQYWETEQENIDRELWLEQRLTGALSPEVLSSSFNLFETEWKEGSMLAGVLPGRSLGLVCMRDFTMMISDDVYGIGRAYGVFRNGYSVLLLAHGPVLSRPQEAISEIVGKAILSR